ncbi:dihydrolipoyllysine-residue acetyltransferase [Shewanella avicenniae]|uniref:Dihydrolipoamide acetyltransferase component of pyruvate dehydrogenase complex n=1 Tax=Shewanella avicenniae TaxID=2814294 RepID=A0ABX7QKL3_9GAMM|nr:dihydrolipoyllysine-residue acetyltransferase [Shewanella avicenniae]QSX31997.1 dihydrolipoyllysine-residue acetyltransferase [Shewanella avicenniae]
MIKDFILPDIGEGVVECELMEWLIAEGDSIAEDQPVCEVMTDKALVQIPAPYAGLVTKLFYKQGEIAKVHQPLFSVQLADETLSDVVTAAAVVEPATQSLSAPSVIGQASGGALQDFLLPDIGEGIVECELVEWLVTEGEAIQEDQPVCDVMTDKALVQIPAMSAGVVTKLYWQKGDIAKVHAPLYQIQLAQSESSAAVVSESAATQTAQVSQTTAASSSADVVRSGKAVASPAVRRMARSYDVDIALVAGSGKHGRVYKEDITRYLESAAPEAVKPAATSTVAKTIVDAPIQAAVNAAADRVQPIKGVQAAMAKQMSESVATIPHFTYCEEIDMTALVKLRERLKSKYSNDERKLTLMPFIMKSLSLALNEFPIINSQVNAACTELTYKSRHNIGMAVDSKVGLLVPNIKDVQQKSILQLATDITRLTNAARSGRLAADDMKDGTITISNIGVIGGTVATPIINKPEVAIVALGKIQRLPRFDANGNVEARDLMQISWSGDHRVIDGATMARFCNLWKQYLESPEEMIVAL